MGAAASNKRRASQTEAARTAATAELKQTHPAHPIVTATADDAATGADASSSGQSNDLQVAEKDKNYDRNSLQSLPQPSPSHSPPSDTAAAPVADKSQRHWERHSSKKQATAAATSATIAQLQQSATNLPISAPIVLPPLPPPPPQRKRPAHKPHDGAPPLHRTASAGTVISDHVVAAAPAPSSLPISSALPPSSSSSSSSAPNSRRVSLTTAAVEPLPSMRLVRVASSTSRRNSDTDEHAASKSVKDLGVRAPSPTVAHDPATSSAATSVASSARSSARSSAATSKDTSPSKLATAAASSATTFGAQTSTASASIAHPAATPRKRARSAVSSPKAAAASKVATPTTAAVAVASSALPPRLVRAGSVPLVSVAASASSAASSGLPASSPLPLVPARVQRSASLIVSSSCSSGGGSRVVLPNSHPLDSFLDSWAWLPPSSSSSSAVDPFVALARDGSDSGAAVVRFDPPSFPDPARSLITAMDSQSLLHPTPSQLELLWRYAAGLGGSESGVEDGVSATTVEKETKFLSQARLILFASDCASKLQLAYAQSLRSDGNGKTRKWKHVFRALSQDRRNIFPNTGAATAASTPKASPSARNRSINKGNSNKNSSRDSKNNLANNPLLKSAYSKACPAQLAVLHTLSSIMLRHLDRDGDGRVSKGEFMAGWTAAAAAVFDTRLDEPQKRDGEDGVIACSVM